MQKKFSDLYLEVRIKENRIYTNEEVRELPYLKTHTHTKEWNLRSKNTEILRRYIQQQYSHGVKILEIGSGNGWLSNFLSEIPNSHITGIEINEYELEQAKQVFQKHNLVFEAKNLADISFSDYDIIIFAASIQYFEQPQQIFNLIFSQNSNSVIFCTDTLWYRNEKEAQQAKQRSEKYYTDLGYPEMAQYYYHHSIELLNSYTVSILNNHFFYKLKLKIQGLPFMPCIEIKK